MQETELITYHGCSNRCQIWAGSWETRRESTRVFLNLGVVGDVGRVDAQAAVAHASVS